MSRLIGLLDAQRSIAEDLSLPAMLGRIVRASCALVDAGAGSLIVLGVNGRLDQVVRHGDYVADPDAESDRLDVSVTVRGRVFGHLHLTRPGAGRFDPADADAVRVLAGFAGCAIENARLDEDARRVTDWLRASGEIARALLAGADGDALLEVVNRALHVAEADYAALVLPTADGQLRVEVAVGLGSIEFRGRVFDPMSCDVGQAIRGGRSLMSQHLDSVAGADYANDLGYGPIIVAPLVDARGVRGGVVLIRTLEKLPFAGRDLDLVTTFADQVALALQLNDARLDARSLHVLEDRHELSQALHDSVMQRLFATGVGLQGLADRDLPVALADRLRQHVSDLDETIDEIRARVFEAQAIEISTEEREKFARMPHDAFRPEG